MTAPEAPARDGPPPQRQLGCLGLGCVGWGLLVVCGLAVVWILMIPVFFPEYPARYRLTVEVETPNGLKTGSSVNEARYGWQYTGGGITSSVDNSITGEAVFVDLGDGRNLVVTLTHWGSGRTRDLGGGRMIPTPWEGGPMDALNLPAIVYGFPPHHKVKTPEGIERAKAEGPKEIEPFRLPTTVTFSDATDPKSAQLVDPTDLEATFGPGYRIRRAIVEMTDAPLTQEIIRRLNWTKNKYSSNYPVLNDRTELHIRYFNAKETPL